MGSDPERPEIVWQEVAPELWEARLVGPSGLTLYAGYMARTGRADPWRGYVGAHFDFVAIGERAEVRRAVEEGARALWLGQPRREGTAGDDTG